MKFSCVSKVITSLLLVLVSLSLISGTSSKSKNIKKVQTYWDEVWGKGNLQGVADFYHPNAKHGEDFTIEGFQKDVSSFREAFPDFRVIVNDIFATADKVITEVTYVGTHTGRKMFKQEPLGKSIKVPGIDIFTFKDGKCINHQHVADHLDLVRQMGLQLTPSSVDRKQ
jgi:predicted ester cyclase